MAGLRHEEVVRLDFDRLEQICDRLGHAGGEVAICAAVEDLASLLVGAANAWRRADLDTLDLGARQIAGIADRIGMTALARVAGNVAGLCTTMDDAALSACVARMTRLGDESLAALWRAQDTPY